MSMWQFFAALSGAVDDSAGLSVAEQDDLWAWMKSKENGD